MVRTETRTGTRERATLNRRSLIRLAAGAGAASAAVGARGIGGILAAKAAPALKSDQVTLTYWHGWTDEWTKMVQYVVDMFEAKQDKIKVKPQVVPSDQLLTKLTAAIASGNPPDIVTLFGSTAIPTLASQEGIVALDSLSNADLPAVQEWMDPNIYKLGEYDGHLYGLSYWAGCYGLIYNAAHFKEAGLDPAKGPASIADLDAAVEKLTQKKDNNSLTRLGFLPEDSQFWLWGTVFGGKFYDPASKQVTANDPKLVEALDWCVSYPTKYGAKNVAAFTAGLANERAQNLDPLIAGKYSIVSQGPWKLGDIRQFAPKDFAYGVVRPPLAEAGGQAANWTWGDIQVVPKGSKDPEAAMEFVKFTAGVGDPEGYAKRVVWGDRPINVPVSKKILEEPSFQAVVKNYPGFQTFIDSLLTANVVGSPPVMPAAAYYSDRLTSSFQKAMLLQGKPQELLDQLTKDVQSQLDKSQ